MLQLDSIVSTLEVSEKFNGAFPALSFTKQNTSTSFDCSLDINGRCWGVNHSIDDGNEDSVSSHVCNIEAHIIVEKHDCMLNEIFN